MQTEKSQSEGKQIMPETSFTEFPTLSVDQKVGISQPALETDVLLFFLPMKNYYLSYVISFIFDILCRIMTYCLSMFFAEGHQ